MAWIDHGHTAHGYWGDITSSLIWCEEKYRWSRYIAEPVNTITNFCLFTLSAWGIHKTRKESMPARFVLAYLGCMGVSIGSFAFHATLKYEAQLLDELPMIYTMAIFLYCVLESTPGYGRPRYAVLLPSALVAFVTFVTVAYLYNGDPVFHQVAYGLMQVVSVIQVASLLRSNKTPLSDKQKSEVKKLFMMGSVIFVSAFGIWNIDNICCAQLRAARHAIGYPWALLLEGHGWWHLGTGTGAYFNCVAAQRLMMSVKENDGDNFVFAWSLGGLFPYVKRARAYKAKPISGTGNGRAKAKQG